MSKYKVKEVEAWLLENNLVLESSIEGTKEKTFVHLTNNSKEVQESSLFICKGAHFKKQYLQDALDKGAICYITENTDLLGFGDYIHVKDIRKASAVIANNFYEQSWKKLKLIGVTGTKGKSTTAYLIKGIIDEYLKTSDEKCGILSSIENYDGALAIESHLTTQEPIELHRAFYNMVHNGCTYCVMEVSSQALKYDRVWGIEFDIGVFLNIGEDHISDIEHSSFEDYYTSKQKIMPLSKVMIVNDELEIYQDRVIRFGYQEDSKYQILKVQLGKMFNRFSIKGQGDFELGIGGDFNISNAAAAVATAIELKIPLISIQKGLVKARVSGRMEIYKSTDKSKIVIVDYAHNKLSYEALFASVLKEYAGYNIVTVFGCPGNKAQKRRQELPEIAEKFSDYIFITEEDFGEEDINQINREILSFVKEKDKFEIENDREKAIKKAIDKFGENVVVLVLGKGRETRQKRGLEYIEVESDVSIVKKYL